jgi:radical SAM superfamily enzyme YgiQ (UPF0313 family)
VELLVKSNQKTITTAPEAGTDRLRQEIHKGITNEEILEATKIISENGLQRLKAYFILGLPTETKEDLEGIITLARKIKEKTKGLRSIRFSCGFFVPKPWTRFQDETIFPLKQLREKRKYILKNLGEIPSVQGEVYSSKWSRIQTILSTGGPEISKVIKTAALLGGTLGNWRTALKKHNLDFETLLYKKKNTHPWEFIEL